MSSKKIPIQNHGRARGRPLAGNAPDPEHLARITLAAFAASGFDGVSLRAIAAAANIDAALISRRYGSKLGLWKATVDLLADRMAALWETIEQLSCEPGPFPERFARMIGLFVSFCCEVPELGRFFTDEVAKPGERRDYLIERIWKPNAVTMQPFLETAYATGLVRSSDVELMVFLLVGMVAMPLMMSSVVTDELGIGASDIELRLRRAVESILLDRD